NPLLDGVSMQGAKGVIISIIGGDDMKLLEVDEAANHIRDLVDPNANIIWGSAFNPDLQGKIRVSVVATGIEQTAEQQQEISRSGFSLGGGRGGIARPGPQAEPAPVAVPEPAAFAPPPVPEAPAAAPVAEPLDLAPEPEAAEPLELQLDAMAEAPVEPPVTPPAGDELLLGDELAAGGDEPASPLLARRRPLVSDPEERAPRLSGGGSTLFERMANLSRGASRPAVEDGEDEDGGDGQSISIPRFLGRQNNQ
ncbi:MAG: cell division protein FtsZ, partial [Sphingomonadales bacterium]|nr:cell division protein FtsZ [Sphingomonadales bacterium]